MGRKNWHITQSEGQLTLSRQRPARLDVVARTMLPAADPVRLAHQIRQDVWRALQGVRGFSPVVRLTATGDSLQVEAGGRVLGPVSPALAPRILAVLEAPEQRARWLRHARKGRGGLL